MSHGFIARFVVHEGQRDEALRVLDAMIAQVAAEPDTLVHQVLTDRDEPNVIWCYGRYTDEAGLKAHQASAVHDAIVPQLRALLTSDTRIHWADARNESLRHSEKMMETIGWSLTVESVPG